MSLSRTSLCDRAWLKNQSGPAASIPLARYDAHVSQAMAIVGEMIAASPNERTRNQLKKDFTIAVTSGVGDLTTSTTASEPMLDNALNQATITSADSSFPWQYIPTYEVLSLSRPTYGLIYFSVKNGNLVATDADGALGSLSTSATASCNFVPLPSSLSGSLDLEELGISTLAKLVADLGQGAQDVAA
jgi:hypothetical protein